MKPSKRKRIYEKYRNKQEALLPQSAMDVYQLNTNAIISADDTLRILAASAHEPLWGDCISIMFRNKNDPAGQWYSGHFSPARVRIFANELLMRADLMEAETGKVTIDKPIK